MEVNKSPKKLHVMTRGFIWELWTNCSPLFYRHTNQIPRLQKLYINNHYYHYTRPNDKLPSLNRSFSRAKRQSAGCKWNFQPPTWFHVKQSVLMKYICTIWPDVLIKMIITWPCRGYSLFVSLVASFAPPLRSGANDATSKVMWLSYSRNQCLRFWLRAYSWPSRAEEVWGRDWLTIKLNNAHISNEGTCE